MARIIVNMLEAKARLSEFVDMVLRGDTVTITEHDQPLADLVAHRPESRRQLRLARGRIRMPEDFTAECGEIDETFYGGRDEASF